MRIVLPVLDWSWLRGYLLWDAFKCWSWYVQGRRWSYDAAEIYQSLYLDDGDHITFAARLGTPLGSCYDIFQLWLFNVTARRKAGSGSFILRLEGSIIRPRQYIYAVVDPVEWGNNFPLHFDAEIRYRENVVIDLEYHGVPIKVKSFEAYGVVVND